MALASKPVPDGFSCHAAHGTVRRAPAKSIDGASPSWPWSKFSDPLNCGPALERPPTVPLPRVVRAPFANERTNTWSADRGASRWLLAKDRPRHGRLAGRQRAPHEVGVRRILAAHAQRAVDPGGAIVIYVAAAAAAPQTLPLSRRSQARPASPRARLALAGIAPGDSSSCLLRFEVGSRTGVRAPASDGSRWLFAGERIRSARATSQAGAGDRPPGGCTTRQILPPAAHSAHISASQALIWPGRRAAPGFGEFRTGPRGFEHGPPDGPVHRPPDGSVHRPPEGSVHRATRSR